MPGAVRSDEKKAEEGQSETSSQKEDKTADLTWGFVQVLLPLGVVIGIVAIGFVEPTSLAGAIEAVQIGAAGGAEAGSTTALGAASAAGAAAEGAAEAGAAAAEAAAEAEGLGATTALTLTEL